MQAPERVSTPTWLGELSSSSTRTYSLQLPSDVESNPSSTTPNSNRSSIIPLTKDGVTDLQQFVLPQASQHEPAPSMSTSQLVAFISITCVSQLLSLSAMNQTVAPVMILARYFRVHNYGELSWFSAAYSMSVGTFILPAGRLGDMYGHKKVYLFGWFWFSIWSLITGFSYSTNSIAFSTFRALQGIGPALLIPNAIALIGRTLPAGQQRMIGFACFGACGPLGATLGAVFSALVAQNWWWPCNFWILAAVALIIMGLAHVVLPGDDSIGTEKRSERLRFDWMGTLTGVTGLILVNFALNQAPLVSWTTPYIGITLGLGILLLVAFVFVELRTSDPLVPIRGLSRDAIFALTCIVAGWASHGIWYYNLYLFLEHLRNQSAVLASAQTSPVTVTGILFAFSTVYLICRLGVSYVMLLSMIFFAGGALLLATMPLHQTYWAQTFASVLIMPGAMNLSYPAANILMSTSLPKEKQGVAASLVSTLVNYSISAGLGFAGSIDRYTMEAAANRRDIDVKERSMWTTDAAAIEVRLVGLRSSLWFAAGLGGLGILIAGVFVIVVERRKRTVAAADQV